MSSMRHTTALLIVFGVATLVSIASDSSGGTSANNVDEVRLSCPPVEEEIADLKMLVGLLKKTRAVGLLTKNRLRIDIKTLISRLEAAHNGTGPFTLAEIQEQYDVLLMKIAAMLQDKDIFLHQKLCNAWDSLWADLKDPDKFRRFSM